MNTFNTAFRSLNEDIYAIWLLPNIISKTSAISAKGRLMSRFHRVRRSRPLMSFVLINNFSQLIKSLW